MSIKNFVPIDCLNPDELSEATNQRLKDEDSLAFATSHTFSTIISFIVLLAVRYFIRSKVPKSNEKQLSLRRAYLFYTMLFVIPASIYVFYRRRTELKSKSIEWNQRVYFILASISAFVMINVLCVFTLFITGLNDQIHSAQHSDNFQDFLYFLIDLGCASVFLILLKFYPIFRIYKFTWYTYAGWWILLILSNFLLSFLHSFGIITIRCC